MQFDRSTGKMIDGESSMHQQISDVLSTRIGSRVHRRGYGSRVPELIDRPLNGALQAELAIAASEAIELWVTDVDHVDRVWFDDDSTPSADRTLNVLVSLRNDGTQVLFENVKI